MREDPNVVEGVRGNRAFLARTVRYLASQGGIRQFLDIGTGIPAADNTHEVAQAWRASAASSTWTTTRSSSPTPVPCSTSGSEGATAYFDEDLRNVAEIVRAAARHARTSPSRWR